MESNINKPQYPIYNLAEIQDYFQSWHSPQELSCHLKALALDMTLYFLKSNDDNYFELKQHLIEIKNFIISLDEITEVEEISD